MSSSTKESYVFKVCKSTDEGDDWYFHLNPGRNGDIRGSYVTTHLHEASAYDVEDVERIVLIYQNLLKDPRFKAVKFYKVVVQTNYEMVSMNEGEFLDERKRKALSKLDLDDVEALDLQSDAVYTKLKFHEKT